MIRRGNAYRIYSLIFGDFSEINDCSTIRILIVIIYNILCILAAVTVNITNGNGLNSLPHKIP